MPAPLAPPDKSPNPPWVGGQQPNQEIGRELANVLEGQFVVE